MESVLPSTPSCCVPTSGSPTDPAAGSGDGRVRSPRSTPTGLISIEGAEFTMGSIDSVAIPGDHEAPLRRVRVESFEIGATAVTNADFGRFAAATGYVTVAERLGSSAVFHLHATRALADGTGSRDPDLSWWVHVEGASWRHPDGPASDLAGRFGHPVTHISWHDANEYCSWSGARLPTEAEWEYAARGGTDRQLFWWGDELEAGHTHHCNVFQGVFPTDDSAADGYSGTAPARSFEPNRFGLYNPIGNVWEWCGDRFDASACCGDDDPTAARVLKGGSFLCHASYCNRYRLGARTRQHPHATASNVGFRIARST